MSSCHTTMHFPSQLCLCTGHSVQKGRLQAWCGFCLCNKWECGTSAARLSAAPIDSSLVFSVTTVIIITMHGNGMLFRRRRRSGADWWHMMFPWQQLHPTVILRLVLLLWMSIASSGWSPHLQNWGKMLKIISGEFTGGGERVVQLPGGAWKHSCGWSNASD